MSRSTKNLSISKKRKKKRKKLNTQRRLRPLLSGLADWNRKRIKRQPRSWRGNRIDQPVPTLANILSHCTRAPSYSNRNGMRFAIFFPVTTPWLVGETLGEKGALEKRRKRVRKDGRTFSRRRNVFTWAELRNAIHAVHNNFCVETRAPCELKF